MPGAPVSVLGRAANLGLLACCLTIGVLWLGASPAFALSTHVFSTSFGSQGSGAGQVSSPQGVAVNQATGNVYVADTGNARVDEFSSSGTFIRAWGWGVADGASSFESCTTTCQAGISGSGAGQFTTPTFVAVDNSAGASAGEVYVGDTGDNLVTKFTAAGALVGAWGSGGQLNGSTATNGPFGALAGVTVDTSGNLWVYDQNANMFEFGQDGSFTQDWNSGRGVTAAGIGVDSSSNLYVATGFPGVTQFTSSGTQIGDIDDSYSSITGIAVDPSGPDLYVDDGGLIHHYNSSCNPAVGCTPNDTFGSGDLSNAGGLAVDSSNSTVYAADAGDQRINAFTVITLPDVSTGTASNVGATSATLNGMVNPDSTTITDCHFDYVDAADYNASATNPYSAGGTAPCSPTPSGSSPVAVSAAIPGLQANTTYHFRIQASNANGASRGADATFQTPPPPPPPSIDATSSSNLTSSSVDLTGQINPNGTDTTYHFQYGLTTGYGTTVPIPDAEIGAGSSDVAVSQHITGLQPNTEYHYRLIATNPVGTTTGPDHTFSYPVTPGGPDTCPNAAVRTGLSARLPDCRAYELVNPVFTNGQPVFPQAWLGSGFAVFTTIGAPGNPGANAGTSGPHYLASRNSSGWVSTPMAPPASLVGNAGTEVHMDGLSADGQHALFDGAYAPGTRTALNLTTTFWMREPDGSYVEVGPTVPPATLAAWTPRSGDAPSVRFQGASPDLSRVLFGVANQLGGTTNWLWPGDHTVGLKESLYEYVGAGHTGTGGDVPALVGVDSAGQQISQCGTFLGGTAAGGSTDDGYNAISADGSRVFFTAIGPADPTSCPNGIAPPATEVFARTNESQTTAISEPTSADCSACNTVSPANADFQGASQDGSRVFFLTAQPLLPTDTDTTTDLYMYDFNAPAGQKIVQVSAGGPGDGTPGTGAGVQGVARVSEDGSKVYFVANGVLTTEPNSLGQVAQQGNNNLYVWQYDQSNPSQSKTVFVTALAAADSADWDAGDAPRPVEASPDGRYLLFQSVNDLTPDASGANAQLYRYDSQTGQLTRVTIGEDGFNNDGNVGVSYGGFSFPAVSYSSQFYNPPGPVAGSMSADGTRIFFTGSAGLTPQALDDPTGTFHNIYEWEQSGTGSCPAAQSSGCVYLISDGQDRTHAVGGSVTLGGTDASGNDAYFTTADTLVAGETDGQKNLYDARVNGGFAPGQGIPTCAADTCQGAPAQPPPAPTPATVTFTGPGNGSSGTAPTPKVTVLKKPVRGTSFFVSVKVPAKGRITIAGASIRRAGKSISRAGTYRLKVTLTAKQKRALKHKHKLKLTLRVAYIPATGTRSAITFSITDKA